VNVKLHLRSRLQPFRGRDEWLPIELERELPAAKLAIIVCDMWDHHWCKSAERRGIEIAHRMERVLNTARDQGMTIIHAPSETMAFYADWPQRRRAMDLPPAELPTPIDVPEPAMPVDTTASSCDDQPECTYTPGKWPWTRQMDILTIADEDYITDVGQEVLNIRQRRGIELLLIMGVHTNMCILNRSFAIRNMTRHGVPIALVRDLTDAMYNPRMAPFVSHDAGTALVIEHIEKHWCPSLLSRDLVA